MDAAGFKDFAKEMVDYVAGYLENIRDRCVNLIVNERRVEQTTLNRVSCSNVDAFSPIGLRLIELI